MHRATKKKKGLKYMKKKLISMLTIATIMVLAMGITVYGATFKTDILKQGESADNVSTQTFTVEVDKEDGKGGVIIFETEFEKAGTWVVEMIMSEPMDVTLVSEDDEKSIGTKTYKYTKKLDELDMSWAGTAHFVIGNPDITSPVTVRIKSYVYEYEKPGKVKLSSVKNVKGKKAKVTWKKIKGVKGYEIVYGLNKKCTKGKKNVKASASSKSKTIKKLKKGKTYYFKIRAYKIVEDIKIYGTWSNVKKVKIKK